METDEIRQSTLSQLQAPIADRARHHPARVSVKSRPKRPIWLRS